MGQVVKPGLFHRPRKVLKPIVQPVPDVLGHVMIFVVVGGLTGKCAQNQAMHQHGGAANIRLHATVIQPLLQDPTALISYLAGIGHFITGETWDRQPLDRLHLLSKLYHEVGFFDRYNRTSLTI